MSNLFFTSSENNNKFGVYKVVKELSNRIKRKKKNIKFSNKIREFINFYPKLVHIHGCWKLHLLIIFLFSKIFKIKIVVSPHGMLDPFSISQKKIKKIFGWHLYQKFILLYSDLIIVNSTKEKQNVLSIAKRKLKIKIINHGVEINSNFSLKEKKNKNLRFIFFSRIHPSKNLINLLKIWTQNSYFEKYNLDIYGTIEDKNYYLNVLNMIKSNKNIKFKKKSHKNIQNLISNYSVFVHPSLSENFGLVILEALSAGTFVILSKNLDWKIIDKKGFGASIKFDAKNLISTVNLIEKKISKINSVKFRKKQISFIKKNYNWDNIAEKYINEYLILLHKYKS